MPEYINKNKFKIPKGTVSDITKRGVIAIHDLLNIQPIADVAKVKHGKWIDDHCSKCGYDIPTYMIDWQWKSVKTKYCPNCGAYMRKRRKIR